MDSSCRIWPSFQSIGGFFVATGNAGYTALQPSKWFNNHCAILTYSGSPGGWAVEKRLEFHARFAAATAVYYEEEL